MLRVAILTLAFVATIGSAHANVLSPFAQGTSPKKAEATKDRPNVDRAKVVADINANLDDAIKQLQKNDAGAQTTRKQQRIVDLLKELLNDPAADNSITPPTPPDQSPRRPQDPKPSTSESKHAQMKTQASDPAPSVNNVTPSEPAPGMAKAGPAEKSTNPKAYDGRWGDFRLRPLQMIDAVGRDRFMPRYEELLRDYYRAIAENDRRPKDGN